MDLMRYTVGIVVLGFVAVTHLIGFNNAKVFETFWIPEFVLILYVIYTLVPFEKIPEWVGQLKKRFSDKRRNQKVVKINSKWNKISVPVVLDGLLITAVASMSFFFLYRIF